MSKKTENRVTIYFTNENGFMGDVKAIEATLVSHGRVKYAQYDGAISVVFRRPRQRLNRQIIATFRPYVLIVKGWGHEAPPSPWATKSSEPGVVVQEGKHSAFSDNWVKDFETWLEGKIANMEIVADYRGANPYERKYT